MQGFGRRLVPSSPPRPSLHASNPSYRGVRPKIRSAGSPRPTATADVLTGSACRRRPIQTTVRSDPRTHPLESKPRAVPEPVGSSPGRSVHAFRMLRVYNIFEQRERHPVVVSNPSIPSDKTPSLAPSAVRRGMLRLRNPSGRGPSTKETQASGMAPESGGIRVAAHPRASGRGRVRLAHPDGMPPILGLSGCDRPPREPPPDRASSDPRFLTTGSDDLATEHYYL